MTARRSVILSLGFALALTGCVVFASLWINMSISYTYLNASFDRNNQNARLVRSLLEREWSEMTEQEVLKKLRVEAMHRKETEPLIIKVDSEQNVIWLDDVRFEFEDGKLKKTGL